MVECLSPLPLQAAHRKQTLLVTALYKTWPRLTFLYTYLFCYYEIFLPVLQFHFPPIEDGGEPDEQEIRTDETKTENDAEASSEVGMDYFPSIQVSTVLHCIGRSSLSLVDYATHYSYFFYFHHLYLFNAPIILNYANWISHICV